MELDVWRTENKTTFSELETPFGMFYLEIGKTKYSAWFEPTNGNTVYFDGLIDEIIE